MLQKRKPMLDFGARAEYNFFKSCQSINMPKNMEGKMKKGIVLGLALVLAMLLAAPAGALELGVRATYWVAFMDADIKVDVNNIQGNDINVKDLLGMDSNYFTVLEAWMGMGKNYLYLGFLNTDFGGTRTINEQVTYNGVTYPVNTELKSDMDLTILDLSYEYRLLDINAILAGFDLGLVANAKLLYVDTSLYGQDNGGVNTEALAQYNAIVPMFGVRARLGLLVNILEARAILLMQPFGEERVGDLLLDVSFTPFPFLDLHVGWRSMVIDVSKADYRLKHHLDGPFAGLSVHW